MIVYKEPLVFLNPKAFTNPDSYYNMEYITKTEVEKTEAYLQGTSKENPLGIKESILNTVWTCYRLYQEMIETLAERGEVSEYSGHSYIGTVDGIMLIDGRLPDNYDHHVRGWYRDSMRHKGDLTMSLPFVGAASSRWSISLSTALFASRTDGISTGPRQALGVAGVSIYLYQMLYQLLQAYPKCADASTFTCMIINDNGRIILHTDLVKDPNDVKSFAGKHITEIEHDVARILIKKAVMKNDTCFNSKTSKDQHFWKINMASYPKNLKVSDLSVNFEMAKVSGTNVYIIIKDAWHSGGTRCYCNIRQDESKTPVCNLKDPCECPCHNITKFDMCDNNFPSDHIRDASYPCYPDQRKVNFGDVIEQQKKNAKFLQPCHVSECEGKSSRWLCKGTFSCSWCNNKCSSSQICQITIPISISEPTQQPNDENSRPWKDKLIYGLISFVILVILVAIIVSPIIVYRCKRRKKSEMPRERFENTASECSSVMDYYDSVKTPSPTDSAHENEDIVYTVPPSIPYYNPHGAKVTVMVGQTATVVVDLNKQTDGHLGTTPC